MISNQKQLFNFINAILELHGYIKKKETWYLQTSECICFFTLGKSPYGGSYGEALGCFLKEIDVSTDNKEYPEYFKSHLRISISFFLNKEIVEKVFNLENHDFINNQREDAIKSMMENYVLPFLKNVDTKKNIEKSIIKYPRLKNYIKLSLKSALGMPTED